MWPNPTDPSSSVEVDGTDFPDALSADPAAVAEKGAVLLTDGPTQAPETAAYLVSLDPSTKYALGGPAAAADPGALPAAVVAAVEAAVG